MRNYVTIQLPFVKTHKMCLPLANFSILQAHSRVIRIMIALFHYTVPFQNLFFIQIFSIKTDLNSK